MVVSPEFLPWLRQQVAAWADRYVCNERRAFPAWATSFLFEVPDDDAFNQTETLTQGDAGLDGWYHDRQSGVFHLIQAKYLDDPIDGQVSRNELDALLHATLLLRDPAGIEAGPHADKLTTVALELEQAMLDDVKVSLDFFVAGKLSAQTRTNLEQAVAQLGPNYSAAFFDTERLYEVALAESEPIPDLKTVEVDFRISEDHAYFERAEPALSGVGAVVVAVLDGRSLGDAVADKGARLFHSNVRYYLKRSNRVNKAMLATLDDSGQRNAFWLYNNGITLVADKVEVLDPTANGVRCIRVTNPQIVNGAQTSSVLKERRGLLGYGDVAVQARIIAVTEDDAGRDALQRISEFTNSQSPVKLSDLRSNESRQKVLQASFAMLTPSVFYERRRGEFSSLSPAERQKYHKTVKKEEIGQRFLAYSGQPAVAVSKKDAIFDELEADVFNPAVSAQVYMLADELYEQADALLTGSQSDRLLALVPSFGNPVTIEEGAPTVLETIRPSRGLACAHATALARDVLLLRYQDDADRRASVLRHRLADSHGATATFVWKVVFRSIRQWVSAQPDKSGLKAAMQRTETLPQIRNYLVDLLADADITAELPGI